MNNKPSFSQYGQFDENARCFRLTAEPPMKWWNLHCTAIDNEGTEMYAEVAHCNDGPVWTRDADGTTCELVGYDQKYHYVRDDETNATFCPSGLPAPTDVKDRNIEFHCEKTVMESRHEGLLARQRVFVPRHLPVEATSVWVTNESDRLRKVSVFAYAMFQLTGKDSEGRGLWKENSAHVLPEIGGVLVSNRHKDLPNDRFKGYHIALENFFNGNGYRDHFTRLDYSVSAPRILWGWDCDGRPGYGPDCAGILQVKLELAPGQTGRADFLIGQCSGKEAEFGQIYLNPQSWAVLSGVADEDRALAIMAKVDEMLEDDIGYRIFKPPYARFDPRVGRMSESMPGSNENGGCYNHAAGFKGVADCLLGRAEQAWRTFQKVTPDNPDNPVSQSGAESFSYVNSFSSVPEVYARYFYLDGGKPANTGFNKKFARTRPALAPGRYGKPAKLHNGEHGGPPSREQELPLRLDDHLHCHGSAGRTQLAGGHPSLRPVFHRRTSARPGLAAQEGRIRQKSPQL